MTSSKSFISDILLERFVLNEVSNNERIRVEVQLNTDKQLQQRLQAIHSRNEKVFSDYPINVIGQQLRNRLNDNKTGAVKNLNYPPYGKSVSLPVLRLLLCLVF